jgi:hypothetical protein
LESLAGQPGDPWWNLRGAVFTDDSGGLGGTGYGGQNAIWINGCVVRWRIEPVRLYDKAFSAGTPPSDGKYVVNPPLDPSQQNAWESSSTTYSNGAAVPGTIDNRVQDFYHFRIVTQAYALTDPNNQTAQPWASKGGLHTAAAQGMRIIQIQSLQLFRYALFYAAPSPQGDLDLQTGGFIHVKRGSVHSNGAIYIRGGESNGFNQNPKNWHQMASGDWNVNNETETGTFQSIYLGESSAPINVTGVAGVFRMGKTGNCLAFNNGLTIKNLSLIHI